MEKLILGIASLLVGISKAGFGAGVGIAAVPLMTLVLPPTQMLGILLPLLITGDIFSLFHYPKKQHFRNLSILIPGCIIGVAIGSIILKKFMFLEQGEVILRRFVGIICIAFVFLQVYKQIKFSKVGKETVPYQPRIWQGVGVGIVAGLTSTLAHAAGPLILLFLLPQKLDKKVFVGTALVYFFVGNSVKLIPYISQSVITFKTFLESASLIPFVVLGTLIGAWLNKKVSGKSFTYVIYVITLIAGLKLLI